MLRPPCVQVTKRASEWMSRFARQLKPSTEQVRCGPIGESGLSTVLQVLPFWSHAVATASAAVQSRPVNLKFVYASGIEQPPEPPVVVVVAWPFFLPVVAVLLGVVDVGIGEVTAGGGVATVVLVSPLESEPHPASRASRSAAKRPGAARLLRVTFIAADSHP